MEPSAHVLTLYQSAETRRLVEQALQGLQAQSALHEAAFADIAQLSAAAQPDLVLLELAEPNATAQCIERIRAASARAGVLVLATADDERLDAVFGAGADDFALLPLRPGELLARVRLMLRARERAQPASALQRYADLLSSSAGGLAAFDADGRLMFANPAAHAIIGGNGQQLLGVGLSELVPAAERRAVLQIRQQLARGEYPHDVDLTVVHRSSKRVTINGSFSPLSGSDGSVLLSFRDVTEERRTRDDLVHTRNFLQSLIDASVDAIVAADMQGTIILFNKGAQQLYGHDAADAIGKMNARALYPGDGAREVMRMLRSRNHGGVGRLEPVRIEAVDSRGTIFPISLTAAMIYEGGVPTATFGIFTDLRERVRVEQQLAQAQEKLALTEKQALVAELAGATAHELNQPLTSVMGYSELLLRKLPGESATHRAANMIHSEAQRMAEIVRKIGKLTRYETKSYVGDQRILDLDRASGSDDGSRSKP